MNNEDILKELEKFRKKVDKIFIGKTPIITGDIDKEYDVDIYIWRHPGMGNSKQVITGNPLSIYTATASYLETLLRQGIISEKELKDLVNMSIKASKGKLK